MITLFWPAMTALALAILVGAWAVVTGVSEIVAAIHYRREIRGEVLLALVGLVSVLAGIAILVWPTIVVLTIAIVAGLYAFAAGSCSSSSPCGYADSPRTAPEPIAHAEVILPNSNPPVAETR